MAYFLGEGAFDFDPIIKGREDELAPSMQRRLDQPRPSAEDYYRSLQDTEWLRQDVKRLFSTYDLLLLPNLDDNGLRARFGLHRHRRRERARAELPSHHRAVRPHGVAGHQRAIRVERGRPAHRSAPIIGRHFDEATVLHAAAALEARAGRGRTATGPLIRITNKEPRMPFDTLIRNATVVDGTNSRPIRGRRRTGRRKDSRHRSTRRDQGLGEPSTRAALSSRRASSTCTPTQT